jgi:hypothetical protein
MNTVPSKFSFVGAFGRVPKDSVSQVRSQIYEALGIKKTSRNLFGSYLRGETKLSAEAFIKITQIFQQQGIEDIWGT